MKTKIHALAGITGFLTILTFWLSTVYSELFGTHETIAAVKAMVLQGMFVLIPAMVIAGSSGMALGGKRTDAKALAKKKRMPFIAMNGLLVLIPAAVYLDSKASAGLFDTSFYLVQVVELIAGAINLTLMGLNIRDGLTMTSRIGINSQVKQSRPKESQILEQDGGPLVVKGLKRLSDQNGNLFDIKPVVFLCRCGASKDKPFCDGTHNEIGFNSSCSSTHTPDGLQQFEGRNITVFYNNLLCSHASECTKLKHVFDPSCKPWIKPDKGAITDIVNTIEQCPSGALSFSLKGQVPQHKVGNNEGITIEKNGPYRVVGVPLVASRACEGSCPDKLTLCRCGASKNNPYCDGSHSDIEWQDK